MQNELKRAEQLRDNFSNDLMDKHPTSESEKVSSGVPWLKRYKT